MADAGERATAECNLKSEHVPPKSHGATSRNPATLADLGDSKTKSSRWQKLADLPEDEFETCVDARDRVAPRSVGQPKSSRAQKRTCMAATFRWWSWALNVK
jgi:hypothetical protein